MRKFKFKEYPGISNMIGAVNSSYKFVPNKVYDYDSVMKIFIDGHPKRFVEVINDVEVIDEVVNQEIVDAIDIEEIVDAEVDNKEAFDTFEESDEESDLENTIIIDEEIPKNDLGYSEDELKKLHWTKLKVLAETNGVEYTNKEETINNLLKK